MCTQNLPPLVGNQKRVILEFADEYQASFLHSLMEHTDMQGDETSASMPDDNVRRCG